MRGRKFCKNDQPLRRNRSTLSFQDMYITDSIAARIEGAPHGEVFFVSDFSRSGNDVFISRVLSRLVDQKKLARLATGVYYKPRETDFGMVKPSIEQIVRAIARRDHAQIMPTGQTAENRLGLSTQIPLNHVYLTTGSARSIVLGNTRIVFKRSAPRNFAYKGELIPTLIQAMKSIGRGNLTDRQRTRIKELLSSYNEPETFEHDLALAPLWIKKIITQTTKALQE